MNPVGRPLAHTFGLDLEAWDETPASLLSALHQHRVVRVRGVDWNETRQLEITAAMGTVVGARSGRSPRPHPNIRYERGVDLHTDRWHADLSWSSTDAISVLVCIECGADPEPTEFLDTSVAIDEIGDHLMGIISDRTVFHDLRASRRLRPTGSAPSLFSRAVAGIARRVPRGRQNSDEWWASWPPHLPHDVVVPRQEGRAGTGHPLVDRRVPDGRRFLRVGDHAWRVSGLEAGASNELLSDLHDAIDQPRATWRQDWQLGDAIFYDNRMILHRRGGSAGTPPERVLRRTLAAWPDQAASADV